MRLAVVLLLLLSIRVTAAELTLEFQPRWRGAALPIPSSAVSNDAGQPLRITRLAALVSQIELVRADGETVQLNGQYGCIDAGSGRLSVPLHAVPPGTYTGLRFQIGLPAAINHADPGQWAAGHPLNPLTNHLHWSWQGGYVFLALEGRWASAPTASESGFLYHLAGDPQVMPLGFSALFEVKAHAVIQLGIDLSRVLAARHLAENDGSTGTHSAANDPTVAGLVSAVRHAVFFLGVDERTAAPALAAGTAESLRPSAAVATHPIAFAVPPGFPAPTLPADNPLTQEGVALGRALFTDRRLSGNGTQSCADCHAAARAFSDHVALSRGADGRAGVRNAMPLFNLAWAGAYAWDGSKPHVRDQVLAAMKNPIEMHADLARVVATLNQDAAVRRQTAAAFGAAEVTAERLGLALEQYLLTIVSADSRFDRALLGQSTLTEQEKEGFALFMTEYDPAHGRRGADCFHCHGGPLFTDYDFKNNGLDAMATDAAREGVTGRRADAAKFKTPSLRNVALTGPYMHDGRFTTLEQVIAHYDHGVVRSATLDPNLAKHPPAGLQLTSAEQQALVAFLRTLTDARWDRAAASD